LYRLQRQTGLGAVESLDLALLVDREDDGMRRRIDIKPDDVAQLGDELRVGRQLELTHSRLTRRGHSRCADEGLYPFPKGLRLNSLPEQSAAERARHQGIARHRKVLVSRRRG
jgi:hypothetical protein